MKRKKYKDSLQSFLSKTGGSKQSLDSPKKVSFNSSEKAIRLAPARSASPESLRVKNLNLFKQESPNSASFCKTEEKPETESFQIVPKPVMSQEDQSQLSSQVSPNNLQLSKTAKTQPVGLMKSEEFPPLQASKNKLEFTNERLKESEQNPFSEDQQSVNIENTNPEEKRISKIDVGDLKLNRAKINYKKSSTMGINVLRESAHQSGKTNGQNLEITETSNQMDRSKTIGLKKMETKIEDQDNFKFKSTDHFFQTILSKKPAGTKGIAYVLIMIKKAQTHGLLPKPIMQSKMSKFEKRIRENLSIKLEKEDRDKELLKTLQKYNALILKKLVKESAREDTLEKKTEKMYGVMIRRQEKQLESFFTKVKDMMKGLEQDITDVKEYVGLTENENEKEEISLEKWK